MWIVGIDYGSKIAGTTVLCRLDLEDSSLSFASSLPKKDADIFINQELELQPPLFVFMDAPLSLPLCYQKKMEKPDFFYREADRKLKAMSPLFLGGLTARAMRLAYEFSKKNIPFYETYPARQAEKLHLDELGYKKDKVHIPQVLEKILQSYPTFKMGDSLLNWHQIDSLLALVGAWRFYHQNHEIFGSPEEGQIYL